MVSRPKHQRSVSACATYASEVEGLTLLTLTNHRPQSRPVSWMKADLPAMQYDDDEKPVVIPVATAPESAKPPPSMPIPVTKPPAESGSVDQSPATRSPTGDSLSSSIASMVVVEERSFNRPRCVFSKATNRCSSCSDTKLIANVVRLRGSQDKEKV